jgi:integrase
MASLRRFFQNEPLGNIGPGKIERYKTSRRAEFVKDVTLRHDLHNLSLLFQYGIKQGWCSENPMRSKKAGGMVDIPSDKDAVRMYILTEDEEAQYFTAAAAVSEDLHDVGRLMILQGCRREEVMSLEQVNVNLRSRTFRITRGKSHASKRELEMYAESAEIFAKRLQKHGRWVFPSSRVRGQHITKLVNAHNQVREETGLEFVMYDFRHTIATRWVEAGVDLPTVAAWLGHSSLACIMKYVHIQPKHRREAKDQYERQNLRAKGDGASTLRPRTPVETDGSEWTTGESVGRKAS